MFHVIDLDNWVRKEHYMFFQGNGKIALDYAITSRVDVTHLYEVHKEKGYKFYPLITWCILKAVNEVPEYRMGLNEKDELGYWEYVNANYTVFHPEDGSYSDLWTMWNEDFEIFYNDMIADMKWAEDKRGLNIKLNPPENLVNTSNVPWMDFTSYIPIFKGDLPMKRFTPNIEYGKYVEENGRKTMALAVRVNHGVADGWHTSEFYRKLQIILDNF